MAAYFKKKQSPAYKGNFENLGAVFGLFATTASRQQARDVYNLGSPLPPPLEAFHLLLPPLLIELQDPGRVVPLPHRAACSGNPAVKAYLANHPLYHQVRLWKLMSCSERTVLPGEGRI